MPSRSGLPAGSWTGGGLGGTLRVNADIMVRTVLLMLGFAWFTNQGARYGDTTLAANHVLLQLVSFSAFFLDGFAFATEGLVGKAVGAGRRHLFDSVVRRSTRLAAATAALLAMTIWLLGPAVVGALTDLHAVRDAARRFLPYAAVYVALSFPAFQLDGVFIGATRTREMRNASAASLAVFLVAWRSLAVDGGNRGLWLAFVLYVLARARRPRGLPPSAAASDRPQCLTQASSAPGGAPAAELAGGVAEGADPGVALEQGAHGAALSARAATVDDAHAAEAAGSGLIEIVADDVGDVARSERVQVENVGDRELDRGELGARRLVGH